MSRDYLERVKEIVQINKLHTLKAEDIWAMLEKAKPIIFDGHFELLSEMHTDTYFRFAMISQYPYYITRISEEMCAWLNASNLTASDIDVVLGPTSQGMLFAFNIAGRLERRVAYATINKTNGKINKELAPGFEIKKNERVLIVNDLTTTGEGVETLVQLVEEHMGEVKGICLFANRAMGTQKVQTLKDKHTFHAIIDLTMSSWDRNGCPLCGQKDLIKSAEINHMPIYSEENEFELYLKKRKDRAA